MRFSLILPTYRVAKYIMACLESCCCQTSFSPQDYEIIIVNDETPDDSIEVAQLVINRYPEHNWKIVNRKNGGLSAARNSGIPEAKGDYIWFVDSDDFIEPESLSVLNNAISQGDFDIINFTHKTIFKNNRIVGGDLHYDGYTISGVDYLAKTNFLSACTCIYKRDFLLTNNLHFKEGVLWEDSEFNIRAYMLTKKCFCISNALYNYIRRENSISDVKATSHSTRSHINNAFDLDTYFCSMQYTSQELGIIYSHVANTLVSAIGGLPELEEADRKMFRGEIRSHKKQYMRIMYKCSDMRAKIIMFSFLMAPSFSENLLNKKIHEAINRSTH